MTSLEKRTHLVLLARYVSGFCGRKDDDFSATGGGFLKERRRVFVVLGGLNFRW